MTQAKKKQIFWFIIMGIFIIFLVVCRIKEVFFSGDVQTEKVDENIIEAIDNKVLILSDGSIDSSELELEQDKITYSFEQDNYDVTETVTSLGTYSVFSSIFEYNDDTVGTFEYIICAGGFLDFYSSTEIGSFDDPATFNGFAVYELEALIEKAPDSKIILLSIPYYEDLEVIEDYEYTIADYNLALEKTAKKFDNVYYLDIYTDTLDSPIPLHNDGFYYEKETNDIVYKNIKNLITEIEKDKE